MAHLDLIVAAAVWLVLAAERAMGWHALLALPSTVVHEFSHWSVALVTGSRPSGFSVWPRRYGKGWVLGSVVFEPRALSAGCVALAPLWLLLPFTWWGLTDRPAAQGWPQELAWGVALGYTGWASLPSSQDVLIALKFPAGSVLVLTGLYLWMRPL